MLLSGLQDDVVAQVPQPADKLMRDVVTGTLVQERLAKLPKGGRRSQLFTELAKDGDGSFDSRVFAPLPSWR